MDLEKIGDPINTEDTEGCDFDEEALLEPRRGLFAMFKSKHPIGQMNGHWATLFKFVLIIAFFMTPTLFAWMVWSTTENFANQYNRDRTVKIEEALEALHLDINDFQKDIKQSISNIDIHTNRLRELENRLNKIESEHQTTQNKISVMDSKNSEEHTKILVLLEAIKTKMDLIHKNE